MAPQEDLITRARSRFEEVPWSRLVGIGDSIVEGELGEAVDGYQDMGWFQQVAEALQAIKPGFVYKNLAKRYLKSTQILETQLPPALEWQPDVAVVMTGGNDMLVERFDVRRSEANQEAIVAPLMERGVTVFVGTMYDIFKTDLMAQELHDLLAPRFEELHQMTIDVAKRCGAVLIDFAEHPISADPSIYSSDLQHANRRGHAIAAEIALDAMAEHAGAHTPAG